MPTPSGRPVEGPPDLVDESSSVPVPPGGALPRRGGAAFDPRPRRAGARTRTNYLGFVVAVGLVGFFAGDPFGHVLGIVVFLATAGATALFVVVVLVRSGRRREPDRTVVSVEVSPAEMRVLLDRRDVRGEAARWER